MLLNVEEFPHNDIKCSAKKKILSKKESIYAHNLMLYLLIIFIAILMIVSYFHFKRIIQKNKSIKHSEPVTASVIVAKPFSIALQNRWAHFFKSKKYYAKEFRKASKLAVIKMQKTANDAHLIVNARVQTSVLRSSNPLEADRICAVAYGTAITYY